MVKNKNKILLGLLTLIFMVAVMLAPTKNIANGMQIFVAVPQQGGVTHTTLEVEPTDRIEDVIAKLGEKLAVDTSTVHLIFAGRCISEEMGNTLQDWSIQKDSTLTLVYPTGDSACHSTENCGGVYVNDECCRCEKNISVVYTPKSSGFNWLPLAVTGAIFIVTLAVAFIILKIAKKV